MPLKIIREDITRLSCDAIVNAANGSLLGGGGVDGAIHAAAGPELLRECMTLGGCVTGDAKVTKGYRLPCNYVIHTVSPIWEDGQHGEEALLRSCYRRSMALALEYRCESMGFPLISAGSFGYPKAEALRIAVEEISAFLQQNEMLIYLVIFDKASFQLGKERFADIDAFINDHYVEAHTVGRRRPEEEKISCGLPDSLPAFHFVTLQKEKSEKEKEKNEFSVSQESLEEALKNLDESFSEMLLRVIDEKGMTDAECYKKANIDRKLFSKIRNDRLYRPSKSTAMAFAIALELPLDQARDMLRKAGFALSNSNITDIIVEYHIRHQNYDIHQINMDLFQYDQALLGA